MIEGSNGASDYGKQIRRAGNSGLTRSFGNEVWLTAKEGNGLSPSCSLPESARWMQGIWKKASLKKGCSLIKIGGPAYRIGEWDGVPSSMIQGENIAELDFNAVQRGDAEIEQKLNRVISACVELAVITDNKHS